MKIYGVAILAGCFLIGQLMGDFLGVWLHIDGNVGGVGFAMLLLIVLSVWMKKKKYLPEQTEKGILFWNAMYIPVVIAMSSTQNVKAALTGGWVVVLVGLFGTAFCFYLVPIVAKIGEKRKTDANQNQQ